MSATSIASSSKRSGVRAASGLSWCVAKSLAAAIFAAAGSSLRVDTTVRVVDGRRVDTRSPDKRVADGVVMFMISPWADAESMVGSPGRRRVRLPTQICVQWLAADGVTS